MFFALIRAFGALFIRPSAHVQGWARPFRAPHQAFRARLVAKAQSTRRRPGPAHRSIVGRAGAFEGWRCSHWHEDRRPVWKTCFLKKTSRVRVTLRRGPALPGMRTKFIHRYRLSMFPVVMALSAIVGCDAPPDAAFAETDTVASETGDDTETSAGEDTGDDSGTDDGTEGDQVEWSGENPIVLGETVVRGPEGPMTVTYEDIDGIAVVDGDIELGPVEGLQTPAEFEAALTLGDDDDVQYAYTPAPFWGQHWSNGTVFFVRPTFSDTTNQSIRNALAAMGTLEGWPAPAGQIFEPSPATNLRFVAISPFLSSFLDHIAFGSSWMVSPGFGRSDSIGRKGGRQFITFSLIDVLNNTALGRGLVHHELGHAVGLYHEHQRMDRDDFVTVLPFCIQAGRASNFDTRLGIPTGPYDQSSIMHYFANTFSIAPGCPTLVSKDGSTLGGNVLTASDIQGLNWLAGLD